MNPIARWIGRKLADYLTRPIGEWSATTSDPHALAAALQPGDVLLIASSDHRLVPVGVTQPIGSAAARLCPWVVGQGVVSRALLSPRARGQGCRFPNAPWRLAMRSCSHRAASASFFARRMPGAEMDHPR